MKIHFTLCAATTIALLALHLTGFTAPDPVVIKSSTTTQKGKWHVIFRETIKSKDQSDWTEVYKADVEVYKDGVEAGRFHGSTLPNSKPNASAPADYEFSVVSATCSLPKADGQQLYYTWTRGKRATGNRPCLRLAKQVPTVNVGSARVPDKFLAFLKSGSLAGNFQYAEDILVHSGWSEVKRESAGCLTIKPTEATTFFNLIPDGDTGTLEVNRGIEDEQAQKSYCF